MDDTMKVAIFKESQPGAIEAVRIHTERIWRIHWCTSAAPRCQTDRRGSGSQLPRWREPAFWTQVGHGHRMSLFPLSYASFSQLSKPKLQAMA
jgi:hypothetical protein